MVKTYEDYLDKMYELFPELEKDDIDDIVKYGVKKMFYFITEGHDFTIDYYWPKSSLLVSSKNDTGMTRKKQMMLKRKQFWLNNEINRSKKE